MADYQVEERFCVKLEERNLELNKNWPKGTPCDVKFSLNEEGILAVHCEVDKDKIDFELTITGVKTQEEMEKSTIAIGKTVVSWKEKVRTKNSINKINLQLWLKWIKHVPFTALT